MYLCSLLQIVVITNVNEVVERYPSVVDLLTPSYSQFREYLDCSIFTIVQ